MIVRISKKEKITKRYERNLNTVKRMAEPITTSCSPSPRRMISHPKPHMKSE